MSICSTAAPISAAGKRCYTIKEWCDAYGLSRSTFYNLVATGKLTPIRLAGRTMVTVEETERFFNEAVEAAS